MSLQESSERKTVLILPVAAEQFHFALGIYIALVCVKDIELTLLPWNV